MRPTQGTITVDGVPVSEAQLRDGQQSLGYVPQEIFLTDTSIAENSARGILKAQIDQAQVERNAHIPQVHEFIVHDLRAQYEILLGECGCASLAASASA